VIKILGDDDPREDSWIVALEEGLLTEFGPEALAEASVFREASVGRPRRAGPTSGTTSR